MSLFIVEEILNSHKYFRTELGLHQVHNIMTGFLYVQHVQTYKLSWKQPSHHKNTSCVFIEHHALKKQHSYTSTQNKRSLSQNGCIIYSLPTHMNSGDSGAADLSIILVVPLHPALARLQVLPCDAVHQTQAELWRGRKINRDV